MPQLFHPIERAIGLTQDSQLSFMKENLINSLIPHFRIVLISDIDFVIVAVAVIISLILIIIITRTLQFSFKAGSHHL